MGTKAEQSKLGEIFKVEDPAKRTEQLVAYAKRLKVNVLKTKKENGDYSEDQLAVLIYDAEERQRQNQLSNIGLIMGALFIFFVLLVGILLLQYMIASGAKKEKVGRQQTAASFEG